MLNPIFSTHQIGRDEALNYPQICYFQLGPEHGQRFQIREIPHGYGITQICLFDAKHRSLIGGWAISDLVILAARYPENIINYELWKILEPYLVCLSVFEGQTRSPVWC